MVVFVAAVLCILPNTTNASLTDACDDILDIAIGQTRTIGEDDLNPDNKYYTVERLAMGIYNNQNYEIVHTNGDDDGCDDIRYFSITTNEIPGTYYIETCASCKSGYTTLKDNDWYWPNDNPNSQLPCRIEYQECQQTPTPDEPTCAVDDGTTCSADTDCESSNNGQYCNTATHCCVECLTDEHCASLNDPDWTNIGGGKQQKRKYICQNNACELNTATTLTRCVEDYYLGDDETTCNACPTNSHSPVGSTSITACCRYSGSGNTFTDINGNSFYYETKCCYGDDG